MAEKKFALDIHSLLSKLNKQNLHIYEDLSEEEKKSLSSYLVSQWLFGSNSKLQTLLINELVNPYIFPFAQKHPELLLKLLACCGVKSGSRFKWIPLPRIGKKEKKLAIQVVMETYEFTEQEASGNMVFLSNEDILEMSYDLGWSKEEITKLKKELI